MKPLLDCIDPHTGFNHSYLQKKEINLYPGVKYAGLECFLDPLQTSYASVESISSLFVHCLSNIKPQREKRLNPSFDNG